MNRRAIRYKPQPSWNECDLADIEVFSGMFTTEDFLCKWKLERKKKGWLAPGALRGWGGEGRCVGGDGGGSYVELCYFFF